MRLRTTSLLIGPSGVGRPHLIERLGQLLHMEVLRVTVGDWIPAGARAEPHTLKLIRARIAAGKKFILQIDELDKFRCTAGSGDWFMAQMTELLNMLDRRLPSSQFTADEREKFKLDAFCRWDRHMAGRVGGAHRKPMGFGGQDGDFDLVGKVRKSGLYRPAIEPVPAATFAEPLNVADFERIARDLKVGPAILQPAKLAAGEPQLSRC